MVNSKMSGPRRATVKVALLIIPVFVLLVSGAVVAAGDSADPLFSGEAAGEVPFYEDGQDVSESTPEYTGLMRLDGEGLETCFDGHPVRVPSEGIPDDIPVTALDGTEYESMEAAQSASQARIDEATSGEEVPGVDIESDDDGGQVVVLRDSEKFRPSVDALCERFGSAGEE